MLFTLGPEEVKIINALRQSGSAGTRALAAQTRMQLPALRRLLQLLIEQGIVVTEQISPRQTIYRIAKQAQLQKIIDTQQHTLARLLLESEPTRAKKTNKKPLLVFCDQYIIPALQLETLSEHYTIRSHPDSPVRISQEAFLLRCKDADVIVTFFSTQITRRMLKQCPRLKYIIAASVTTDMIDTKACQDLGITVCSLRTENNYKKGARIEFVFAALFHVLRPLGQPAESLRMGRFDYRGFRAEELRGKTIGVVGVQREGKEIIPLLRAFGCGVEVCNADNLAVAPSDFGVVRFSSLPALFKRCDVIIFPEDTTRTITLGPSLMNTAMKTRYFLLLSYSLRFDLEAMRQLIISQHIASLVLDYFPDTIHVFTDFPQSDYRKIMNFPNVIITPELGFYTKESMARNNAEVYQILRTLPIGDSI